MKEISIEEKAKRYDEALERAKEINNEQRAQPFNVMTRVFPELKESEGERIRKEIARFIKMEVEDEIVGNKWIAWLEKQGEANQEDPRKKIIDDILVADDIYQMSVNEEMVSEAKKKAVEALSKLEIGKVIGYCKKEGHAEPFLAIEPKFKVHDIISKNGRVFHVVKINQDDCYYDCVRMVDGVATEPTIYMKLPFTEQDKWKLYIKFQ